MTIVIVYSDVEVNLCYFIIIFIIKMSMMRVALSH